MAQLPSVLYYVLNKMDVYIEGSNWNKYYRFKSHSKRVEVVIVSCQT